MSMDDIYAKLGHLIPARAADRRRDLHGRMRKVRHHAGAVRVAGRDTGKPGHRRDTLVSLVAFDRSTLGNVLERLEAKGLIERAGSPHDKRIKTLRLSREGARTLKEVEPAVVKTQERILALLKLEDRRRFMALLAHLVELNNEASRAPLRLVSAR